MTIGFVFECGPQGADKQVCEYLASQLKPGEIIISRTLDNKLKLLEEAPSVVRKLLDEGCDRVLIVWDLRPAWPDKKEKPCRAKERQTLLDGLAKEGLQNAPVFLVCVEQELESWLLASDHAISAFLSTDAHPYQADRVRKPDRVPNPPRVRIVVASIEPRTWGGDEGQQWLDTDKHSKTERWPGCCHRRARSWTWSRVRWELA